MNQKKTFDNYRVFKTQFAGRELTVETGKTCELSNGSCWVRYGDTVVMAKSSTRSAGSPAPSTGAKASPPKRLYLHPAV